MSEITLAKIPANSVVYDRCTRLFPFSPRREVDSVLVERLKRSMAETGIWQPIVVRDGTMEGIAGNHRFLAWLEVAEEQGLDLEKLTIPTALIDCDEGLAVSIALIENEFRENLTKWEMVRTLLKAAEQKPQLVESVFEVNGETIEQLRFWEGELDYEAEARERRKALQARLTRQWLALINDRLGEYPELRTSFLGQLRYPTWVQARSLNELDRTITRALLSHGIRFEAGETWNDTPTPECLRCQLTCGDLLQALRTEELDPQPDGTIETSCPHLRIFPLYTEQFVPTQDGMAVLAIGQQENQSTYPLGTLMSGGRAVQGDTHMLLDGLEAYCVAPDIHEADSCFHQKEMAAARQATEALEQDGLPAVLPTFVQEREEVGEFTWRCPQQKGQPCAPERCLHASDDPPGFAAVVQPGGTWEMICIDAVCGEAAQEALVDWEAKKREEAEQQRLAALNELRQTSVERTLLAPQGERIDLSTRSLLEAIESVLVPEWDAPTMFHIVLGWQAAIRVQMADELGIADFTSEEVTQALREHHGELVERPASKTIRDLFAALRGEIARTDEGLCRWVACLALVRTWRDEVEMIEQIERVAQTLGVPDGYSHT